MLHKYNMSFSARKGNRGSVEEHLMPMTIAAMNIVLASWRNKGFEISNLRVFRVIYVLVDKEAGFESELNSYSEAANARDEYNQYYDISHAYIEQRRVMLRHIR